MKKNGEIKVCLVGSSGGHLTHLYMLKPFWKDKNRFWVTFDKEDARSLLEGEKVYPVKMAIRQRATVLQTSAPCLKPMPQITRNCVLWMSLWTMVTPARTLNGLRSKTCSGNWSRGP